MRFTIRDLLWLTLAVAIGLLWYRDWSGWQDERRELINQRDRDVDNERRLGELRAKEAAQAAVAKYTNPPRRGKPVRAKPTFRGEDPTLELPLPARNGP